MIDNDFRRRMESDEETREMMRLYESNHLDDLFDKANSTDRKNDIYKKIKNEICAANPTTRRFSVRQRAKWTKFFMFKDLNITTIARTSFTKKCDIIVCLMHWVSVRTPQGIVYFLRDNSKDDIFIKSMRSHLIDRYGARLHGLDQSGCERDSSLLRLAKSWYGDVNGYRIMNSSTGHMWDFISGGLMLGHYSKTKHPDGHFTTIQVFNTYVTEDMMNDEQKSLSQKALARELDSPYSVCFYQIT